MAEVNHDLCRMACFLGGEDAINVVKALSAAGQATDDIIANAASVRLNTARKVLYKLYDHALVTFTRVRDEKTGWYIYHWKLQDDQIDVFVKARKKRVLEKIREKLDYERNHNFFLCAKCLQMRVIFEEAMESAFKCTECGGQLITDDNTRTVETLDDAVRQLESELY